MSTARAQLREMIVADIRKHRPDDYDKAEFIVDRLLEMRQLQSDDSVIQFINAYRRAMEKRDVRVPAQ